ncbi:hypothetical protein Tco_0769036 [Tanacetum coccineum]|uniref:Uncharacterized protein n=1 Tax=Tanacetum coccineum TaxID=301880 RepID=A0ABQ4Z8G4_9ASTR
MKVYAMARKGISKKFLLLRRRGKFVPTTYDDKKNLPKKSNEDKKEERELQVSDPNHFISDCPQNFSSDQKAFVVESWTDSRDDSKKEEICLMAHSNEVGKQVHESHKAINMVSTSKCLELLHMDLFGPSSVQIEESLNIKFDGTPPPNSPPLVDDDLLEVDIIENQRKDLEVKENEPLNKQISNIKEF